MARENRLIGPFFGPLFPLFYLRIWSFRFYLFLTCVCVHPSKSEEELAPIVCVYVCVCPALKYLMLDIFSNPPPLICLEALKKERGEGKKGIH